MTRSNPPAPARAITILGIPYDGSSSFEQGAARGPAEIRRCLFRASSNSWTEFGVDLGAPGAIQDAGDVVCGDPASTRAAIEAAVTKLLEEDATPFMLGGDHSVTYPILRSFGKRYGPVNVLHFDAHGDLYDNLDGDRYSHACPLARALEDGMVKRLVQIGIRTFNADQRAQVKRFGVEVIEMRDWTGAPALSFDGPLYVTLDLDVLEPGLCPGLAHPEPGGLSVREVLQAIHRVRGTIVGADVVELNPRFDDSPISGMVAVKFVKELAARMLS
ncbi:MAG: agmatinase [Gemmatimonadota bacterium]